MNEREALKLALEALEIVNREMLTLRDELAERGGRPSQGYHQLLWDSSHKVYTDTAIPAAEAIREALAQPEQEPVAWLIWLHGPAGHFDHKQFAEMEFERRNKEYPDPDRKLLPLYTAPPQPEPVIDKSAAVRIATSLGWEPKRTWVGLTSEDIEKLAEQVGMFIDKYGLAVDAQNGLEDGVDAFGFARAIEAKLKEKNT